MSIFKLPLSLFILALFTNFTGFTQCGPTGVSASPSPALICEGDSELMTFSATGTCSANWEFQVQNGASIVQAWSTTATYTATPSTTTTYTVYVRCSACIGDIDSTELEINVIEEPSVSGSLVVCSNTSTTLTATGSTGDLAWWDAPSGGTQLSTDSIFTTPNLSSAQTYYVHASGTLAGDQGSIVITECGLEGYTGAGTADYLEISNLYATTVNTTGWVAAVGNSYTNINEVNPVLWNIPNSFSPCSVVSRNDIVGNPNYWGSNIYWSPGASSGSWAIIIDDLGNVVDFVAWGWTAADLATFNPTINGFSITLGSEWTGDGYDATCGVSGGAPLSIQRIGNTDNNDLSDFTCQASTVDVVNPGLVCGWSAGISCPYPYTVVLDAPPTASNPGSISVQCFADIPAPDVTVVTDETDDYTSNPVVTHVGDASDGLSCPETIIRTYRITDDCGEFVDVNQTITVNDVTAPTASAPATVTVGSQAAIPPVDVLDVIDEADNCAASPIVAHVGDVSDGLSCPETITRTYSITDECGNQITVDQLIVVSDQTNPTASSPTAINVECIADVPLPDPLVLTDEADDTSNPTVTWEDDTSDGLSCPETISRRYRVTDTCGNFIFVTQTIVVEDITPPVLDAAPVAISVECIGDIPPMIDLNYVDNCDGPGSVTGVDVDDGLSCPNPITRTWTYTDACGNSSTVVQIITVDDITAPVFDPPPAAITVNCIGDIPAMIDLTYTDNCDGPGLVTGVDGTIVGDSCGGTITRTWTVSDICGNTSTVDQVITIDDTTLPTASAPVALAVECIGDVPAIDILVVTDEADNCTANPIVAHVGDVSDGLTCPETITRTYSVTDDCGNQITVDQIITVNDITSPTASAPDSAFVQCIGDVPAVDVLVVNDEADNCTLSPAVAHVGDVSDGLTCPETITRTYSVTDDCGNQITVDQIIVVNDTIAPTASAPDTIFVQCNADIPIPDITVVTTESDNCTAAPVVAHFDDASNGLSCPETITRTYSVTDDCGNQITIDQIILVNDTIAPTASSPAPLTVECLADAIVDVSVVTDEADNCAASPIVAHVGDVSDGLTCPETITRTYSVTDDCGNQITVDQIITVDDITAPTASAPVAVTVECIGDVPAIDILVVTDEADNCTANPIVAHVGDVSDGLTCPETITRTYSVTDDCGNQITVDQIIVVNDTIAPTASAPDSAFVQCIGDVPAVDVLVVNDEADNCTLSPAVAHVGDVSDGLTCPETITRTYSVTDDCGNQITVDQIIVVNDTIAPTASAPDTIFVQCNADIPIPDITVVTTELDNCTAVPVVAHFDDASNGLSCPETITRMYSVTDDCGNQITIDQIILVNDTIAPTASTPDSIFVQCIGDVPTVDVLDVTDEADNCTVSPVVAHLGDATDGLTCPETITRTYSVTDDCGNQITLDQIIIVNDTIAPTASAPDSVFVQCIGDVPAVDTLVVNDEVDNCTANPVVAHLGDVSDGLTCPETITRTYSVTDDCGNQITVDQIITVNDITSPTASAPDSAFVQCIGDVPAVDVLVVNDEADNCTLSPAVAHVGDVSDGLTCPETITRTYSVTDDCGNQITVDQIIVVNDTIAPTASAPDTIFVQCTGDIPIPDIAVVTDAADNCTAAPVVAHVDDIGNGLSCPETITRIYSLTDDCGNQITIDQIILVNDTIAPTASTPDSIFVQCIGDVPTVDVLDVTDEADNCTVSPVVAHLGDATDGLTCPETITRTYSVTDDCGNQITLDQIIIVNDTIAPTASAPDSVFVQCIGDVPAVDTLVVNDEVDNCTANPVVAHLGDVSDGLTCPETITRTYSVTDDCGNQITVDQIIVVNDTIAPTASAPDSAFVQCIGDVPAVDVLVVNDEADNCTLSPAVAHVGDVSDGLTCPETITRTYSVTDDCGNQITVDQIIVVNDTIAPTASAPDTIFVQCTGDIPIPDIAVVTDAADNCTAAPVVAHVDDIGNGLSCPETITRIYSLTDDCGNQITIDQIILVNDTIAPTASTPDSIFVQCIGDVPTVDVLDVTDEADNCTVSPVVAHLGDATDGLTCPETITRTYSVTDDCGNQITLDQIIIVNDTIAPTASTLDSIFVQCIGDVVIDVSVVTDEADNCTANPVVAHLGDVSDGLTCPETITRTYSVTDDCGNQITLDQIIVVNDTIAPTASAPIAVNVECIGDVPVVDTLVVTDALDNCTANPVVAHVGDVSDGLTCPETITRTYSVTDDCGNQITVDQIITVNDVTPPTAQNVPTINVPGTMDVPAPDPSVVLTEADNCAPDPVVAWVSDVSDGNVCNNEEITRTYSITDDCGNETLITHLIIIDAVPAPIDAGLDQLICIGESANVIANNPLGVPVVWDPIGPDGNVSPTQTTTYTVTADNLGCISIDSMTVTVEELPVVSFFGDVLQGCESHTVNFLNTSITSSNFADCIWEFSNGDTVTGCGSVSYSFLDGGLYDVTLTTTSINGCVNSETYTDYIYIENFADAAFSPSETVVTNIMTEVLFLNESQNATDYSWDFGDDTAGSSDVNPSHVFPDQEADIYNVELIANTPLGCADTAYALITVNEEVLCYVPNTFTPDGDQFNQYFQPVFASGYDPSDFKLLIFNRWGEVIWESNDASIGWDGTYGGNQDLVQSGTYAWKIEFGSSQTDENFVLTGHVTLLK